MLRFTGPNDPRLRDLGLSQNKDGYLKYHRHPYRNLYHHRVVAQQMVDDTPASRRVLIPPVWVVHHIDWDKLHNCPGNLLLLEPALHDAMTHSHLGRPRDGQGRWRERPPKPARRNGKDEVPF